MCAQQDDFDRKYNEVYVQISALDGPEALHLADSLLTISKNDEQRIKSHMLLANVHHSLGNRGMEFREALKAQQLARDASQVEWQARISGFLATSFRHVGLMHESEKHLELAEIANEKQKDAPHYLLTKINIAHEKALHAQEEEAYEEALEPLLEARNMLMSMDFQDPKTCMIRGTNDQLFAVSSLKLGKLDLADSLLRAALLKIGDEENNLRPYIYRAQAEIAISRGQADSSLHYLAMAKPYLKSSEREELKMLLYETFSRYYKTFGDPTQAIKYQDLYADIKEVRSRSAKKIADALVSKLEVERQRNENNIVLAGFLVFVLISVLLMLLVHLSRKRKAEKAYYLKLVERIQSNGVHPDTIADTKDPSISDETEERLLAMLVQLEEEAFFLDKEISLTKLATRFGTNQRYISYIIKKYRGKDFNNYIQHSRIHYIISRIRLDRTLLDYKLSYLADMAGFSSHSKFSSVFKTVTGLPPSVFIHFTKDEFNK